MPKKLYRSRADRKLSGVCGGLGDFLNIDPTIVRVVFVIVALIPGLNPVSLIGYLLMAVIIPEEPVADDFDVVDVSEEPGGADNQ
ncbi:MAG: PspC domain-containing protein [Oscillospiraceae bacterium]|nr:PspC domain-containing protein [Oscillospiraceae bacterium]